MNDPASYLTPDVIRQVHQAVIRMGHAERRHALRQGLDPAVTSTIHEESDPGAQLLTDLHTLNQHTDRRCLLHWLHNAIALNPKHADAVAVRRALTTLEALQTTERQPAPLGPPAVLILVAVIAIGTVLYFGTSGLRCDTRPPQTAATTTTVSLVTTSETPPAKTVPRTVPRDVTTVPMSGSDGQRQAQYVLYVFPKYYQWKFESDVDVLRYEQPADFRLYLAEIGMFKQVHCSLGVIGVGTASEEGGSSEEEGRAFRRAEQINRWTQGSVDVTLPYWTLNLGKHIDAGASRPLDTTRDSGVPALETAYQRPLIMILIVNEEDGVDHIKALKDAIRKKPEVPYALYSKPDLDITVAATATVRRPVDCNMFEEWTTTAR